MNRKRLTILRDALIEHAKDQGNLRFDLSEWGQIPSEYKDEDPLAVIHGAASGRNYCGTAACACGLAMSLPKLQREGLKSQPSFTKNPIPVYGGLVSWDAIHAFFDISKDDAEELFSYYRYDMDDHNNPVSVADKITALLHT